MLATVEDVKKLLSEGKKLVLAADETLLRELPKGDWIGGTIPYFMTDQGGKITRDRIFVNVLPSQAESCQVVLYEAEELPDIAPDSPENGFSLVILPAFSNVHRTYALNAPTYDGLFLKPIAGWVAGVHLDDAGTATPRVFAGPTLEASATRAVAMHVSLPARMRADIRVVNIFEQGGGDEISFPESGFEVSACLVNGKPRNFHDYVVETKLDTRLPLVADFCGTMLNVSIQGFDAARKTVQFYAPVFDGVPYRMAKPVEDYAAEFGKAVPDSATHPVFACNCILNFLYGELEGRSTGAITGPITFGEIAYQLLNQTMVCLEIRDAM